MEHRERMENVFADSDPNTLLNSSSPLRRRSAILHKVKPTGLIENDDTAERSARRHENESSSFSPNTVTNGSGKRRSLGLGFLAKIPASEISERITQCFKLNAENKINIKNAFNLEMIDFMTYMIKKQDTNMFDLQVCSTSLDVCSKIYGLRVDGIHSQILKMVGGLDTQDKKHQSKACEIDEQGYDNQSNTENLGEINKKHKKKKTKQILVSTLDALKGNIETTHLTSVIIEEEDLQTSSMLNQTMLPIHASARFYHDQYNDITLDISTGKSIQDKKIHAPLIQNLSHMEICSAFTNFQFEGWDAEEEPEEEPEEVQADKSDDIDNQVLQFDINGSFPPNDALMPSTSNYFNAEDESEIVDRYINNQNCLENIVDFRKIIGNAGTAKQSEYSFIHKSMNFHWAGPSHWKMRYRNKFLSNSKVVERCHQADIKKRKDFTIVLEEKSEERIGSNFTLSQGSRVKLNAVTAKVNWNEEYITLPDDMHYDNSTTRKFSLHLFTILSNEEDNVNITDLPKDTNNHNYDIEHNTSYYDPGFNNENEQAREDNDNESDSYTQTSLAEGNQIPVSKLTNVISIPYASRAKKIDMRQLKKAIWQCLAFDSDKENVHMQEVNEQGNANKINSKKQFSEIYSALPKMLSKNDAESLSFPLAFVSLLHLANEKMLHITSVPDMSDLIIESD